jgi:hypothetical protein
MLLAVTGFCFVLLPGQVLAVGDRALNPGRGIFLLCYPLWIDCEVEEGVAGHRNFYPVGIDVSFQKGGKRAE